MGKCFRQRQHLDLRFTRCELMDTNVIFYMCGNQTCRSAISVGLFANLKSPIMKILTQRVHQRRLYRVRDILGTAILTHGQLGTWRLGTILIKS